MASPAFPNATEKFKDVSTVVAADSGIKNEVENVTHELEVGVGGRRVGENKNLNCLSGLKSVVLSYFVLYS